MPQMIHEILACINSDGVFEARLSPLENPPDRRIFHEEPLREELDRNCVAQEIPQIELAGGLRWHLAEAEKPQDVLIEIAKSIATRTDIITDDSTPDHLEAVLVRAMEWEWSPLVDDLGDRTGSFKEIWNSDAKLAAALDEQRRIFAEQQAESERKARLREAAAAKAQQISESASEDR